MSGARLFFESCLWGVIRTRGDPLGLPKFAGPGSWSRFPELGSARLADASFRPRRARARVGIRVVDGLRPRNPPAGRRAAWACLLVVTLAFKSFVPLLAAAAAQMQGKAVADICAVYGVRLVMVSTHAHQESVHAMGHPAGHVLGVSMPETVSAPSQPHEPNDHAEHAQDHCALTGLSTCAVFPAALWSLVGWREPRQRMWNGVDTVDPPRDAIARWLMRRLHAPPIFI